MKSAMEVKEKVPKLYDEIYNLGAESVKNATEEAVTAERERIKAIDEIAGTLDPKFANFAKYENPMDAKDALFQAVKEGKTRKPEAGAGADGPQAYLDAVAQDAAGANGIEGAVAPDEDLDPKAQAIARAEAFAKKRFGKENK